MLEMTREEALDQAERKLHETTVALEDAKLRLANTKDTFARVLKDQEAIVRALEKAQRELERKCS